MRERERKREREKERERDIERERGRGRHTVRPFDETYKSEFGWTQVFKECVHNQCILDICSQGQRYFHEAKVVLQEGQGHLISIWFL